MDKILRIKDLVDEETLSFVNLLSSLAESEQDLEKKAEIEGLLTKARKGIAKAKEAVQKGEGEKQIRIPSEIKDKVHRKIEEWKKETLENFEPIGE